jgi:uncharacterized protein YbjT (DUF2867 family)
VQEAFMARYVVAGATGRVGSTVARELLRRGVRVAVVVRSDRQGLEWAQRGAEVARGSLDDRGFVGETLRDASGFFTLLPENVAPDDFHGTRRRMADALAGAVEDSGVPHVVLLSALAAVLPDKNGPASDLHYCEQQLGSRARRFTALRACYFQENVASALPAATRAGIYPNFLASADVPVPMIATSDVGRFAADALMNPPTGIEVVDLIGPSYSIRQVAEQLGTALRKRLDVVDIPPARHSDTLVDAGIPHPVADAVAELFAAFNSGLIVPQGDRRLIGTTTVDSVIAHLVRGAGVSVEA